MKRLSTILLAILVALVFAAPAVADSIHLSVSPTSTYLNGPAMTYQVSGETEVGRSYAVRLMRVGWEGSNCGHAAQIKSGVYEWHNVREASVGLSPKFEYSGNLSAATEFYEALGTYVVCAVTVNSEAPAETSASFTVVTPPPPPQPPPAPVVAPTPAPVVMPPPPVAPATPVVKPVSRLAKALKLCKKLKKHSKRVACEKRAKKKYKK
jgi:hypothetical protein